MGLDTTIMRTAWYLTYLDEDDGGSNGHQPIELDQNLILVLLGVTIQVQLLDSLDRELFMFERKLIGVGGELGCVANDGFREGGGEE